MVFTRKVELFVNSNWTDITTDVLDRDKIRISRGKPNESGKTPPSTCLMTLDNRLGNYSQRNPVGIYYGSIGRNTPVRVSLITETDTFTRTVSGGWGSSDTGGAYTLGGFGTVLASDWNVSAGVGTQSLPTANTNRFSFLTSKTYHDVDVSATVTFPFSSVTGAAIEPCNLIVSGLSITDYYLARLTISSAQVISLGIRNAADTDIVVADTNTGLTFTGQALQVRFQMDGQTLRAKVWAASGSEPYAWNVESHVNLLSNRAAGWVGIRSGRATGNTNTSPVVLSYDNFEVRQNRFAGEISSWPPRWDVSGRDVYTPIEASGVLRRLEQGQTPVRSTFYRANMAMSPLPLAYWPCEDGINAAQIAAGIGTNAMIINASRGTPPKYASNSDFRASAPIPVTNKSSWNGRVVPGSATGSIQSTFLMSLPSGGELDGSAIITIHTDSPDTPFYDLCYSVAGNGSFFVMMWGPTRYSALLHQSGTVDFNVRGNPIEVSFELTQTGADVNWAVVTRTPDGVQGGFNATVAGHTLGKCIDVFVNPNGDLLSTAIGHVMVRDYWASLNNTAAQLRAYIGEQGGGRMIRVAAENGVPLNWVWDGVIGPPLMGYQPRDSLINIFQESSDTDMGTIYESRSVINLGQANRSGQYNQLSYLALDHNAGHLVSPFEPTEDDQNLRNDITITRTGGSLYRGTQTTGPLSINGPTTIAGGVGRYDTASTLNFFVDDQLPDAVNWQLHLGTVNEARYPSIKINVQKLLNASTSLGLQALSVNVDNRITVDNPKVGTDPNQISQLVSGYKEEIGSLEHLITFNCRPESPYQVVQLDSAAMGKIDSTTSTLVSGVDSVDTKLFVADSANAWTTAGGDMPIPIRVGGETMSVTGINAIGPSFINSSAAVTGNNVSLNPTHPASLAVGDLKLIFASIRNSGTGTVNVPTGWTQLAAFGNMALLGRVHQSADTAPTVTFTGGAAGADTIAQMAAFRNLSPALVTNSPATLLNASAANIAYPALTVPTNNSVVLYLGWKQSAQTSYATLAGAVEIGDTPSSSGTGAGQVWDYVIQTTAASIGSGSFVITGGTSAISRGVVLALNGNNQTFTVTRSVNGIVKAQAANTTVSLTRPATLAL